MKIKLLASLAAGTALVASGALAQDHRFNWTPAGTVTPTPPASAFLTLAGGSDLYEIESSRLVTLTTANAGVRAFAQMMIDQHTGMSRDVMTAARQAGMTPSPPMLSAPQAAMVAALSSYQGMERDRLYLAQQMMVHKEALGLMRTYAESGDTPRLRAAAQAAVPIIQRHMAEVERLSR